MLLHEDYPHTIPMRAYLRWKENYFWVFMDPDRDICLLAHMTAEPVLDRAYASFTLMHQGKKLTDAREVPMPSPFEHQKELTYGGLTVRFLKPQAEFQVAFENDNLAVTLDLKRRMHLFDFGACADVNPDKFSVSENTALARNEFRHQGQCLTGAGTVRFKSGELSGKTVQISGTGYRDHSWGMRNDEVTLDHNWSFINLPSLGFHMMRIRNRIRPENQVFEGYVACAEGNQVLKTIAIEHIGQGPENMPETVIFRAVAYDGTPYTIVADIAHAFARLPLVSQKPGKSHVYKMVENMCRCRCKETGEEGFANIEIGWLEEA